MASRAKEAVRGARLRTMGRAFANRNYRLFFTGQVVSLAGMPVELTTFEYRILEHMMLRAGDVISKTELTERLYDQDFERDSNVIEVFIGRLRRKLDPDETLHPIETLRGRGYRFALPRTDMARTQGA